MRISKIKYDRPLWAALSDKKMRIEKLKAKLKSGQIRMAPIYCVFSRTLECGLSKPQDY